MEHIVNAKDLRLECTRVRELIACDDTKAAICALSYYLDYLEWGPPPDQVEAIKRRMGPRSYDDRRVYERAMQLITEDGKRGLTVPALDENRASMLDVRHRNSERGKRSALKAKQKRERAEVDDWEPGKLPKYAGDPEDWPAEPEAATGDGNSAVQQECRKIPDTSSKATRLSNSAVAPDCSTAVSQSCAPAPGTPPPALSVAAPPQAGRAVASSDGERGQHPPSSATHVSKAGREPVSARCPQCGVVYERWLEGGQLIRAACEQCPGLVWLEVVPATAPAAPRGAAEGKDNAKRAKPGSSLPMPAVRGRARVAVERNAGSKRQVQKVQAVAALGRRRDGKTRKGASTKASQRIAAKTVNPQPGRKSGGGSRTAAAAAARRRR